MQNPNFSADHDHQTHSNAPTVKPTNRLKRPAFKVFPGQIAFRLVCHASIVGGLIGNSGSIVSQLRRETGCRIHCVDPISYTDDRVILVIGSVSPLKVIRLVGVAGEDDGCETEVEVSNAQEAILRVFERVWELQAEKGTSSAGKTVNGEVWCKLLGHAPQIDAVVGKRGKHITTMKNNSGANIRILPAPHCAAKNEKLIQINGRTLAVKKALIAVSHCLRDCPPPGKVPAPLSTPTVNPLDSASYDLQTELFPHLNSWLFPTQGGSLYDASEQTASPSGDTRHDTKGTELEVVFRLLCSNSIAGSVIGKKGAIVRALESKTGASIIFAPPLSKFAERIVTISAVENLESSYSPAQEAVILVFARIIEDHIGKGFLSAVSMESPVTMRLLIASNMVSCLNGNEGQVISELRGVTGADIQILHGEEFSCGVSDNDMVVQIIGDYRCVKNAIYKVTSIIRDNLFAKGNSALISGTLLPQKAGAGSISENGKPHMHLYDNLEVGRGNKLATVTNTTVEIAVSEHVFGCVYGEDGSNVDRIRQISGANVTVYDPCIGENGGRVVMSGTPDQTFAAQSLLQAFIQAGERTPES